jgi:predicted transcriptional regulator
MSDPERPIFDDIDDEADEVALREGEADADAGRVVPHEEVAKWLDTWGTPHFEPAPKAASIG